MKTNQIMKRDFYKSSIKQRSKDGFLNANDLVDFYNKKAGTPKRIDKYLANKQTKEFLDALINESLNTPNSGYFKNIDVSDPNAFIHSTRGKNGKV